MCLSLWLVMGSLNAYYASTKGRDPFAWFMLGIPLGLLGLILLFFLPKVKEVKAVKESLEPLLSVNIDPEILKKEWYYVDVTNQQRGPLSFKDLQLLFSQKNVSLHSFIWSEGMAEWKKLEELPQLTFSLKHLQN